MQKTESLPKKKQSNFYTKNNKSTCKEIKSKVSANVNCELNVKNTAIKEQFYHHSVRVGSMARL